MKKCVLLSAVFLLGTALSFGSQSKQSFKSQFHNHLARWKNPALTNVHGDPKGLAAVSYGRPAHSSKSLGAKERSFNTNSTVSTVGLVSATQIPTGGTGGEYAYTGDFNDDGNLDLVTLVQNYVNNSNVWSISVKLSNGDGTFKPAVLTQVNTSDPLLVGDLNGDGKADIIQVHAGSSPSTMDVWIGNGDGTFKSGNTYQISTASLQAGLLTDMNSDGKIDLLAVDSEAPGQIYTLLGNGDGTFQSPTQLTLPAQAPSDIVFADFNGDGKVDFAGIGPNNQVNVYLQEGGNFVYTGTPLTTSDQNYNGVCELAAGDLTGDGSAEIVAVNCDDGGDENTVTVYVNAGDGSFATGVYYADATSGGTYPADLEPYAATIADVNGDSKADIVLTNYYGGDVTILMGNGDGTVKVPTVGYATGGYPWTPAVVADFNGDGLPDIIQIDDEYSYAYLQGYGDGTFKAAVDLYGPVPDSNWPEAVTIVAGDFNGDGIKDFAVGLWDNSGTQGIEVFISRGDGSLMPPVGYGTGGGMENVALGDFNGDGKLDIAAADSNNGTVQIFFGNGDGTFTVAGSYPTSEGNMYPWNIVTGDFNKDGHTDIAVNNSSEGCANIAILLNDGTGNFLSATTYPLSSWGGGLAAGDLNGDGYTDLVAPLYDTDQVAVLLANTDGTLQPESDFPLLNGNVGYWGPQYATLADLNGDGKLDMAVGIEAWCDCSGNQGIAVALGNGDGTFQTPSLYSTTNQNYYEHSYPWPAYIQAADINGDGVPDLVYTNDEYSTVGVLFGNGNGTFGSPHEYPAGGDAYGIAVADVNGDGALDVVSADYDSNEVTVLLNANGVNAQPNYTVTANTTTASIQAGASANFNINFTGKFGYTGTLALTCSGLPANAACSFSPASLTISGDVPQSTTLTITTGGSATAQLTQPIDHNSNPNVPLFASLGGFGLFGLILAADPKRRKQLQMRVVVGVFVLTIMLTLVGCSGVSSGKSTAAVTPAGSYTVAVTATGTGSNAVAHTLNLTLMVQ